MFVRPLSLLLFIDEEVQATVNGHVHNDNARCKYAYI